jgi:hypothetical protein
VALIRWPEDFTQPARIEFEIFGQELYFALAEERGRGNEEKQGESKWREHIKGPLSVYTEGVLRHLFPDNLQERSGALRVQNWERLYRFLALGRSEYITEVRELKQLVKDEMLLQDALSSDDKSALAILRSIEVYCEQIEILDEVRLIECLSAASAKRLSGDGDWGHLAGQYADAIEALLRTKSSADRPKLLDRLIDIAAISVSQAVVTTAASDLGEFPGRVAESAGHRLIDDMETYRALARKWASRVEALLAAGAALRSEPYIYVACYRLGQLNGDYGIARAIGQKLVQEGDLARFMRATHLAGEFDVSYGNLDIVWSDEELIQIIERDKKTERYKRAIDLLHTAGSRNYFKKQTTKPTLKPPDEEGSDNKDGLETST